MEINEFIKVYDNTVPKNILKKFLRAKYFFFETERGKIGEGVESDYRKVGCHYALPKNNSQKSETKTERHWNNFFVSIFLEYINKFQCETQIGAEPIFINEMVYLQYQEEDHYGFHIDQGPKNNRHLSALLMLNEDYKGGELVLTDPKKNKDFVVIKPQAGRVIIFPSNFMFPHKVNPVLNGERFTIVSWWN